MPFINQINSMHHFASGWFPGFLNKSLFYLHNYSIPVGTLSAVAQCAEAKSRPDTNTFHAPDTWPEHSKSAAASAVNT